VKDFTIVPPPSGSTELVQYLVNDEYNVMLCDQTGQCQSKSFTNLTDSIDKVTVVGDKMVMMLTSDRKVLRLYSLRSDTTASELMIMEVGKGKIP
jgi:hypothetical protein